MAQLFALVRFCLFCFIFNSLCNRHSLLSELVGVDAPTAPPSGPVPTCQYIDPEDQVKRSFMFDPVQANELWS